MLKSFSVNVSNSEINLGLFALIKNSAHVHKLDDDIILAEIQEIRTGYELWYFFAIFALLMLLLEIFIIKLIEGKSERISN